MYVPVVEKEVRWSKRCKNVELRGEIKELITQVSHSKKWKSVKKKDSDGNYFLEKSYSLLQDRFFEFMYDAGYQDLQRGEKGSSEKNMPVAQFKVAKEQQWGEKSSQENENLEDKLALLEDSLAEVKDKSVKIKSIEEVQEKFSYVINKVTKLKRILK